MADFDYLRGKVIAHLGDDNKGQVEVSLGGYVQDQDKIYARVSQSMTGVYWLPEVGDVVDVAIPKAPGYQAYIINVHRPAGDKQTQECWTEKNDLKEFRTRSGHSISFDDTKDKTKITLQTAGGLTCSLEDEPQTVTIKKTDTDTPVLTMDMKNDAVTLSAGKKILIECGGASLEIDSNGNITIKAKGKLEMSGQEISLNAKSKLTAKGQQVDISGGMTTKIAGQTQLQMTSSGITEVKGSMIKLN